MLLLVLGLDPWEGMFSATCSGVYTTRVGILSAWTEGICSSAQLRLLLIELRLVLEKQRISIHEKPLDDIFMYT